MKIAILSDIHDNIWNLEKFIAEIPGRAEAVIFCGDFCAPFSAESLSKVDVPVYACLGNNDEDHIAMVKRTVGKINFTSLGEEFGKEEFDGKKIAFCHYPKLGELLAGSQKFDAVFYGHTHFSKNEVVGKSLLVNPGAICGIQNGAPGTASWAIYNTVTNSAEIMEFSEG